MISLAILAGVCVLMLFVEPLIVSLEKDKITAPKGLSGLKIAFLSDVHVDSAASLLRLNKSIERINSEQPDIVLLGGDYGDKSEWVARALDAFENLIAPLGVYAVLGNHDANYPAKQLILNSSVRLLEDSYHWIDYNGSRLYLCGLSDHITGRSDPSSALRDAEEDSFVVMLCHNPRSVRALDPKQANLVDVALCGHTHGGQITLFGLYSPLADRPFPAYLSQWLRHNGVLTLYSNGVGTTALPIRFFAPPQMHLITLEE